MTPRTPDPEFEAGEIVRDVCWLGEDHPDFRDDYPPAFPPEPPGGDSTGTAE